MMQKKIVFLDRDGTVIQEKNYLSTPDQVVLLENSVAGLISFADMGYSFVIVTNQSGIGRGYFSEEMMHAVHNRIDSLLLEHNISIEHYHYCPHSPAMNCRCRKPLAGMIERFPEKETINWNLSIMVGDKACDIGFARNAGLKAILVKTGYGPEYDFSTDPHPDIIVSDLQEAASWLKNKNM